MNISEHRTTALSLFGAYDQLSLPLLSRALQLQNESLDPLSLPILQPRRGGRDACVESVAAGGVRGAGGGAGDSDQNGGVLRRVTSEEWKMALARSIAGAGADAGSGAGAVNKLLLQNPKFIPVAALIPALCSIQVDGCYSVCVCKCVCASAYLCGVRVCVVSFVKMSAWLESPRQSALPPTTMYPRTPDNPPPPIHQTLTCIRTYVHSHTYPPPYA